MRTEASSAARLSMKGCRMPAPAPCARSKSQSGVCGRSNSAETSPAPSTTNFSGSLFGMGAILAEGIAEANGSLGLAVDHTYCGFGRNDSRLRNTITHTGKSSNPEFRVFKRRGASMRDSFTRRRFLGTAGVAATAALLTEPFFDLGIAEGAVPLVRRDVGKMDASD